MSKMGKPMLGALCVAMVLAGCNSKGIDAALDGKNEQAYRESLNKAWPDMSAEQQEAFNWAVGNFSIDQLAGKYASMTPRKIIDTEADGYIAFKTQELATTSAELMKNADRLTQEEAALKAVHDELSKVKATGLGIQKDGFFNRRTATFVAQNNSKYNISSATWNAWLFVDDEPRSERGCRIFTSYKYNGGLASGKSLKSSKDLDFDCRSWDTLEVRNAKQIRFLFELDDASVEDFGEKKILPTFSPSRADYENKIKLAKDGIAGAMKYKAVLVQK